MRRNRVAWRRLGAALAPLALAAGCGNGGGGVAWKDAHPLPPDTLQVRMAEVGRHGGRFVWPHTSGPKTFNPILANESSSDDVNNRMYVSLTGFDNGTQQLVPELARRWDVSPDGLTWTWHLRRGAAFSDGHPITSADVLFSFQVVYDSLLHPAAQDLLLVGGKPIEISAPDSYTVVTRVSQPYPLLPHAIGVCRILPRHVLEPPYRAGTFASTYTVSTPPESLVTSGPFRLKGFVPNEKTVLGRNPYWFGVDRRGKRLPYLDELVFLVVPDQNTAALKFEAGEVGGLDDVKPEDYQRYLGGQRQGNYTVYDLGPSLNTNFLWFNLNRVRDPGRGKRVGQPCVPPHMYAWFAQRDFRRAVSMAIDRDAIIRAVMFGEGVKCWSTTTPGNKVWHDPGVTGVDYDPEGAKRLLAGLGFRDRDGDGVLEDPGGHTVSFTVKTNGGNLIRVQMANFVKDDLARIGIRVSPAPLEFRSLLSNLRDDFQYEAILLGLQAGVPPDPGMGQNVWRSSGLTHFWNIKQPQPETAAEAEIDSLIAVNVSSLEPARRHESWRRIQQIMNDECFFIWLPVIRLKAPVRNDFGNVEPTGLPNRLLWNIDRVFARAPGPRS